MGIGAVERVMYAYTGAHICLRQGTSTTSHIYPSVLQALAGGGPSGVPRAFVIAVEPVDGSPDARRSLVHRFPLPHQALDPLLPAGLLGCAPQPCATAP